MSVKTGRSFIAGNVALKVQDRLFYAKRKFENNQEYYDIEVPVGATIGFTQATKLVLIISGTNTTTTPILRYETNQFQIVGGSFNGVAPIKLGELRDGGLAELYIGTSTQYIYLGSNENSYDTLRNTPILVDKDGNQTPLLGGLVTYDTLGLPYIKNDILFLNSKEFLSITPNGFDYGPQDFTKEHHFLSRERLIWEKAQGETYELATLKDIEELAIGDKFVEILTYCRDTETLMNSIDDAENGDKCLVFANNTIYTYNSGSWNQTQVLQYGDEDNGKYFDIEDVDGIHGGKAIWNVLDGGKFQLFIDYTNGIDNVTITRNTIGALQVAKLPKKLTLKVSIPGMVTKEISFDGSEDKILEINTTLSGYYTKTQIDTYYNDNTAGNLAAFYTNGSNTQIHSLDISKANLVLKTTGNYLKVNETDVDASLIKYSKSGTTYSVKTFLDKNFAFTDIVNNFVVGQKIGNALIATQDWVNQWSQNTFLPNKFNLALMTDIRLALNSPVSGSTALRFDTLNIHTGEAVTTDIELPVVTDSNNGLVTPTQRNLWNTVSNRTLITSTNNGITSVINYQDGTPRVTSSTNGQKAGLELNYENSILELKLLASQTSSGNYSGIVADQTGVYSYQNEGLTKDAAHLVVNRDYLNSNAVMQNAIQANGWGSDKVVLNDINIINITSSGASLQQTGSSILTKGSVNAVRPLPIVNSTKAGLATSAMFNQIEANRVAIEALNGQGSAGAFVGTNPTQEDIQNAWDDNKGGIPALEGANVINLTTGDTWRLLTVEGQLTWVNLGVLGGNAIATTENTGIVKSTENVLGMIQVESDGTMSLIGWDQLTSDIENLELGLDNLDADFRAHIADITGVNTAPHVSPSDRTKWNNGVTTANNAIPKLTSAVNNNFVLWSTDGVLKDSGKAFVTNFTTPTDNQIPSALAVRNAINSAISTEVSNRDTAITNAINTEVANRNSAITNAINTEVANRNTAINNAIAQEVADRNTAINNAKPHTTSALTLTASGWSNKTQTITISGYSTSKLNTVVVDPGSAIAWANAGINATTENSNGITFTCSVVPTVNLTFRVISEILAS